MPPGEEAAPRGFYRDLLELAEVAKPTELAARGECWFGNAGIRLHVGVEADFRPARKAHPALRAAGFAELRMRLRAAGCAISEDDPFEGSARFYVDDPFGNRIELIEEI